MAKMHELLAVESDAQSQFKLILEETTKVFKDKPALFTGFNRKLITFDENDQTDFPEEHQALTETVENKLKYAASFITRFLDVSFQKESTNQLAKADIIVDGTAIATDVPATFLLGLEQKLKDIRNMYAAIPTLQVGVEWENDETIGKGIYRMIHPEEKLRTELKFKSQVLYEATDKHPAQIEKWQEQVPTGKYIRNIWSGMMTSAAKHEYLAKIDRLISAVKAARQRANSQEVVTSKIGKALIDFINS